jgi:hypothetical protein
MSIGLITLSEAVTLHQPLLLLDDTSTRPHLLSQSPPCSLQLLCSPYTLPPTQLPSPNSYSSTASTDFLACPTTTVLPSPEGLFPWPPRSLCCRQGWWSRRAVDSLCRTFGEVTKTSLEKLTSFIRLGTPYPSEVPLESTTLLRKANPLPSDWSPLLLISD